MKKTGLCIAVCLLLIGCGKNPNSYGQAVTAKPTDFAAVTTEQPLTGTDENRTTEEKTITENNGSTDVELTKIPSPAVTPTDTPAPTDTPTVTPTEAPTAALSPTTTVTPTKAAQTGTFETTEIAFDDSWEFADRSKIHTGTAVKYTASENRKNITVAVNAGHGTKGGTSVKTLCHPDGSKKTTGGSTGKGATEAAAVSGGMTFNDGTSEAAVTLQTAILLRDILLARGYDVVMLRDGSDVQLDNVARTVLANNCADCHISIHWDGDGLDYEKGAFYISVPDGIKEMYPVSKTWEEDNRLGENLVSGLKNKGVKLSGNNMPIDLTQTSYSTVPTVDMELGNQCSSHDSETLETLAEGLADGVDAYFGK